MTPSFNLGSRRIGRDAAPFVIAEMSGNHNGSKERALEIVRAAAECGVDCLKFQTYTADTITLNSTRDDFLINDPKSLWNGRQLHDLYDEAHTPWEWHAELFAEAAKHGVLAFSTPFDETAVDFLNDLGVPMFKIASFEMTHLPLIAKVARTGKPMIMSTGMATVEEIEQALATAKSAGGKDIVLLKCTSQYPANAADANLMTIPDMMDRFGVQVGLSDHTAGTGVAVASIVLGATVIEKHFTLDRNDGGVDSAFSLEPWEMRLLKEETTRAWHSTGQVVYGGTENEASSRRFRQSIYPARAIAEGELFSRDNLRICRPGLSLEPRFFDDLLGKPARRAIEFGERLTQSDL
ncbi:N-acetylneuraminate synthase [Devosia limi DSM 17137]|uniref:N-acetylneuraminate synthase n=1 Tax=Devosia limi DSM 17137 TaxID=1121477 RepID=A0A0F5LB30_9HYPH|nr:pseudaminic acid synthase [Devosia limi]KKB79409.1 N-acetylneuraminate synthase [Devosia limi DSM 17137]SHF32116.1 N-acetylneuraminate synthase [Devosia limi DSM 17137]